jgi:membrane protease subunit HflK
MPWDNNGGNDKGPWGQAPKGEQNGGNKRPQGEKDPIEEAIKKLQEQLKKLIGDGRKGGRFPGGPATPKKAFIIAVIGLVFAVWLSSGIYTVDTTEQAIVLRLGKYARTTGAGLSYHIPSPIEEVKKLSVTDRYSTEIGAGSDIDSTAARPSRRGGAIAPQASNKEILMLTGDENMIDVSFEVQWQIADAQKFIFNVEDPRGTIRDAAESAMREVIGTTPLNEILSEGRTAVQLQTKELLQQILDSYGIGVTIEEVNMRAVPPKSSIRVNSMTTDENGNNKDEMITTTVDEAFKDVQAALINKEESINSAIARSNELIPQARGNAQKLLQEAQGYKEQVIANAQGQAARFTSVYNEYKNSKSVTKKRIYLETMEDVLNGMDKIILDSKSGTVPYLPLNEIGKKQ